MTGAERHYAGERARDYHETKRSISDQAVPWVARLRAEKLQPHVQASDIVFEFGAGFGWNLVQLTCARKMAFDIADLPLAANSIERLRHPSDLADHSVDVVICHHALEHVVAPAETLRSFHRLLKPGGKLLLFVPFEKERRYRNYDPAEPNHHLFSWNAQTIGNLSAESGFLIGRVWVDRFGYDRFAARLSTKFHLGEPGFRLLRAVAHMLKPACEVRLVATR